MSIRLARPADLGTVYGMVRAAVRYLDAQGIHQWDDIYPDMATLKADIERSQMHVEEIDGCIGGIIVLNEDQPDAYGTLSWRHAGRALVVHRLTVAPQHQRKGIATRLMGFAEAFAAGHGFATIRLDAFTENPAAVALYERLGYTRVGTVRFRKGLFHCFEKQPAQESSVDSCQSCG